MFLKLNIIIIFIIADFACAQEQNYSRLSLTDEEITYLNENPDVKKDIDEFLAAQPLTQENIDFVKDLIALLIESDYKLPVYTEKSYPGKEDSLPFEWWKDPEKYMSFEKGD